ncbi:MAG: hypothetical protein ACLT98_10380 [Eggerthellaceae bacterium]
MTVLERAARPPAIVDVPQFPQSHATLRLWWTNPSPAKLMQCMTSAGGCCSKACSCSMSIAMKSASEQAKSMAYSLTYRAADRTLTSEEVDKAHDRLVKKVSNMGAEQRA